MNENVIIITGSSGFIGSALINKLAGRAKLIGFDKIAGGTPPPAAECICIDLTSQKAIKAAFERVRVAYGNRIASVVHLAAYYDLSGEPSPFYEQITIRGTERLLEQLKGMQVEQFIFSSTMLVHGPTDPGQRINEDSAIDPRWPYPQSKVETEALIHNEHGEIPIALLRLAGVYDDRGHSAFLSQQIARLDEEPFIKPWMVDFADAHYELDISRARRLLAWEPKHSLRESLPKITAALKSDPVGWYRANKLDAARVAADRVSTSGADEGMAPLDHKKMMREHAEEMRQMHFRMIWVHFINVLLGAWLITAPFVLGTFGQNVFSDEIVRVTQERGLWEPAFRNSALVWSDVVSGALIMLFAILSLSPRFSWAQWANTIVGIWLLFAPLVFWSPSAAIYANDTLIGALVISFAILVPMMPGMSHEGMMDPSDVPIGWTYCPSTYLQRLPIVALGAVGFFIARYLAAYQMGHIDHIIDPFFAGGDSLNGTATIITSHVSKAWPVPDGGLGAVTYMFEILMGVMGDRRRWRTMPWMVTMFIVVVVPLGVVSIYFIIIQPIVIGTYCSLCLLAALAMVIMIPYALDELVAMGQYLVQSHRRGESLLRIFFRGGASPGSGQDQNPDFGAPWSAMLTSAVRGVTIPWTLVVSALLGIWLMFSRLVFWTMPPLADSDHLVGAVVFAIAVIAIAEVGRVLRFGNILFGIWLIAAPSLLAGGSAVASAAGVACGLVLIALSLPRGQRSHEQYGSWDRFVV